MVSHRVGTVSAEAGMPTSVSDARSNANDQIVHAATVIGRGDQKRAVFDAVSSGKKRIKTVEEIAEKTGLTRKQVLNAGNLLVSNHIIGQDRKNGDTAYEKDTFYSAHKQKILKLAADKSKRDAVPTKVRPAASAVSAAKVKYSLPASLVRVEHLTVDDIQSLAKVRRVSARSVEPVKIPEKDFKQGFQAIVGEKGKFQDWGGESNDLWTTNIQVRSSRVRTAIAFKGPGTRGALTPGKLGKNGDQIQRLFSVSADLYIVRYWNQVEHSVYEQMEAFALATSIRGGGRRVMYGVINGSDSARLLKAYPREFKLEDK
jgi:hypothetical protein